MMRTFWTTPGVASIFRLQTAKKESGTISPQCPAEPPAPECLSHVPGPFSEVLILIVDQALGILQARCLLKQDPGIPRGIKIAVF